ncbi:MAG: UDP-N-acetylmuramoylalanyl-D-glutamate--2,6-diaminopimelate ligase [Eggerthellaceae bacterium]|jgi:C4-type Zn-finger protein|nr:UDP-N-acetylmuramoylalanyl-D-glutamate--2,6-diaminopimelate ligase [Eggerthellaceae bacterium]
MVASLLTCPSCGKTDLDIRQYDSMMVIKADTALFTLQCPKCLKRVSSMQPIPPELIDEVLCAALKLDAGMGCDI